MNETPSGDRVHISIFGKRNAGKSSIMNALIGQKLSIVSDVKGTTTDPVRKTMELLPLGPVILTDTPGLDDDGKLGRFRMEKSYEVLDQTDLAIVVIDASIGKEKEDDWIIERIREKELPYVVVYNKHDLIRTPTVEEVDVQRLLSKARHGEEIRIWVSIKDQYHIAELKNLLGNMPIQKEPKDPIVSDLVCSGDVVVLVTPIDGAAPKGRLILPQQQTIRELLEVGAITVVTRETELSETLKRLGETPAMVITDSQAFELVSKIVPDSVPLTSFSILFARHKGVLAPALHGVDMINQLKENDNILIAEGCTHHRQCGDIGTEKLPKWIQECVGDKKLYFEFCSGADFPKDLSPYQLIIQCGGCMLSEREVRNRYQLAARQGVPITNYGTAIAQMKGILKRSIAMLPNQSE